MNQKLLDLSQALQFQISFKTIAPTSSTTSERSQITQNNRTVEGEILLHNQVNNLKTILLSVRLDA
ncbi:MAG: hypothetical protein ACO3NK_05615 [Prochlorotrichaceae cyanobacterium]|jgi:hypothetical protein